MSIIRILLFLLIYGPISRQVFAWEDAPSIRAMCHNCDDEDVRPDFIRNQGTAQPAPNPLPAKSQWSKSLERTKAFEISRLPREIIRLDKSQAKVEAPAEVLGELPSGSVIFGIAGAGVLDNAKRPTGFTPGNRIAAENLIRSFSILQHISQAPPEKMGIEDYRFLAEQAEFALEPGIALQIVVEPVPLKSNIGDNEALALSEAIGKIREAQDRLAIYLAQKQDTIKGLEDMEHSLTNFPSKDSDEYSTLKKEYKGKFSSLLEAAAKADEARKALRSNQDIVRQITAGFADLSVKPPALEEIQ